MGKEQGRVAQKQPRLPALDFLLIFSLAGGVLPPCLYIIFQARCLESARLGYFWDIFLFSPLLLLDSNYYRQIMGHFGSKKFSDYTDFPKAQWLKAF